MLNNWFKKEKPFVGFAGFGGGATGLAFGGGGVVAATGGNKYWNSSENSGTMYHIFTQPGNFVVTGGGKVEVLIVAGGGSGSVGQGGGGGGGGVVHGIEVPVSNGTIPVVVGDGGAAATGGSYDIPGNKGSSSSFNGVTAIGGGGGARNNYAWGGLPGAQQNKIKGANCGGGGGGSMSGSGPGFPTDAIEPQPVPGSYVAYGGNYGAPSANQGGGSGGGGGGAGANSPGPADPRASGVESPGGAGKAIPSFGTTNVTYMPSSWTSAVGPTGLYGGGGGGGEDGPGGRGLGGPGGGGPGQDPANSTSPGAVENTGGGGGDRGNPGLSHTNTVGAKGIVMVKYTSEITSDINSLVGGNQFTIGNYTYLIFSAGEDTFTTYTDITCDILLVAGGGGGGSDRAAGACGAGGGGGVIYTENQNLTANTYKTFVASGGLSQPGAPSPNPKGDNGGNTIFSEVNIPSSTKTNMSGFSMPSGTWIALGGGGGAGSGPGNANLAGRQAGTGGGGGSDTGGGGTGVQTTESSLPAQSRSSGSGNSGRTSSANYPARGGGGGGHAPSGYGQGNENQGGRDGYLVPASFLPTSVPASFANLLGASHPSSLGGGIATNSPEWRYFAGGGGASDNVPATNHGYQGSGGLGGGGNAGGNGRTSSSNPRTAKTGTSYYNRANQTSPGVDGRGGGGSGNGLDNNGSSYDYFGGDGGSGIIIIRVHNS